MDNQLDETLYNSFIENGFTSDEISKIITLQNAGNIENVCKRFTDRSLYKSSSQQDYNNIPLPGIIQSSFKYKNLIETLNSFLSEIIDNESEYFNKVYSSDIYEYLLNQRQAYINNKPRCDLNESSCTNIVNICENYPTNELCRTVTNKCINNDSSYCNDINKCNQPFCDHLKTICRDNVSNFNDVITNYCKNNNDPICVQINCMLDTNCTTNIRSIENDILKKCLETPNDDFCNRLNCNINPESCEINIKNTIQTIDQKNQINLLHRKIDYRNKEHEKLQSINNYINLLYYFFLLVVIIYLYMKKKLFIKQTYPIFIILAILPYIYLFVFEFISKIILELINYYPIEGPKNAFLNNLFSP